MSVKKCFLYCPLLFVEPLNILECLMMSKYLTFYLITSMMYEVCFLTMNYTE